MDDSIRVLLERVAGVTSRMTWTPALVESSLVASVVAVELEGVGLVRARKLGERTLVARFRDCGYEHFSGFDLVLVLVEGEELPRWIASERVVKEG